MQVILLEKVQNLGELGETVKVRPGYGRNFLVPTGKAIPATKDNIAEFEKRRTALEKVQGDALAASMARKAEIDALGELVVVRKASEEGKLFGSVGTADVAEAIASNGIDVSRNEIRMPAGSIREVGAFDITVHLQAEVDAAVTLKIVAEA